MNARHPTRPPLSFGAEQLLAALSGEVGGAAEPGVFEWYASLSTVRPDLLQEVAGPALADLRREAERRRAAGSMGPGLSRDELVARAGDSALGAARAVITPADVAAAISEAGSGALESLGETSLPGAPSGSADTVPGVGATIEAALDVQASLSFAAEQELAALRARISDTGPGLYAWLLAILARHREQVVTQLEELGGGELEMWARARVRTGDAGPPLDPSDIIARAGDLARREDRAVLGSLDLVHAVALIALERLKPNGPAAQPVTEVVAEPKPESHPEVVSPEPEPELEPQAALDPARPVGMTPEGDRVHDPAARTRTFRLFVSSTFRDFPVERNLLQQKVFPELQRFCAARNARFQAIDLRWGVSEEAALDQRTMEICLDEIDRCHRVTPRPNFLLLLGDSYGWRPPPPRVPAPEFEAVLDSIAGSEDRQLLLEWYRRDENAVPPEYRLQPRTGARAEYADPAAWHSIERRLQEILAAGAEALELPSKRRRAYVASATEQEVAAGALRLDDPKDRVFCVLRRIQPRPTDEEGNPATDAASEYIDAQREARLRLRDLKAEIRGHLEERLGEEAAQEVIFGVEVGWKEDGPDLGRDYLDRLAGWITRSLTSAIERELAEPLGRPGAGVDARLLAHLEGDRQLREEVLEHLEFAAERRRHFVGRSRPLERIATYVGEGGDRSFCLSGEGGTGKSAVLARALEDVRGARRGAVVVARFIGATPRSSDGRSLLDGLCREISRQYGASVDDIPTDYRDLVPELARRIQLATAERPLVLVLDSLDQIAQRDGARGLAWIPARLPEHVRLVASTRPGDTLDALHRMQPITVELEPMTRDEGGLLLDAWLAAAHPPRTLQPHQRDAVLKAFESSEGRPLYLKLATEEARRWPAWASGDGAEAGDALVEDEVPEPLAIGIEGLIRENLFPRLAHSDNHGPVLVSHALGYLAASRHGLAEDELLALLSRDLDVYTWFLAGAYHMPQDLVDRARAHWQQRREGKPDRRPYTGKAHARWLRMLRRHPARLRSLLESGPEWEGLRLPVVLWSRLSLDLQPYLAERLGEGASLLDFYHRELADAAAEAYLPEDRTTKLHARLADYFRSRVDPSHDSDWTGEDVRGLSELPFHLTGAARWQELHDTLTDFRFLERKAAEIGVVERGGGGDREPERLYTGVFQLQEDFDRALAAMPGGDRGGGGEARRPIILTAVDFGEGYVIRCPFCNTLVPFDEDWLDKEMSCPEKGCAGPWKVNPFVCAPRGAAAGA